MKTNAALALVHDMQLKPVTDRALKGRRYCNNEEHDQNCACLEMVDAVLVDADMLDRLLDLLSEPEQA